MLTQTYSASNTVQVANMYEEFEVTSQDLLKYNQCVLTNATKYMIYHFFSASYNYILTLNYTTFNITNTGRSDTSVIVHTIYTVYTLTTALNLSGPLC